MLVPEENLGVVILTNAEEDVAFEAVLYHILDSYLGRVDRGLHSRVQNIRGQATKRRGRDHE